MTSTVAKRSSFIIPALLLLFGSLGCQEDTPDDSDSYLEEYRPFVSVGGNAKPMEAIVVDPKNVGSITGTVSINGAPSIATDFASKMTQDAAVCTCDAAKSRGDTEQYVWKIKDGKLKNVVIFIRPAEKGKFFDVTQAIKGKTYPGVSIDQPYCAFVPHVVAIFNEYVDASQPGPKLSSSPFLKTGQTFVIKNGASISHNSKYSGGLADCISGNTVISAGNKIDLTGQLHPYYSKPYDLSCTIHPWMKAYIWSFPHPYFDVTGDDGKFEIKGVPAGIKIRISAWHEAAGWVLGKNEDGIEITVPKDKAFTQNVTVNAN